MKRVHVAVGVIFNGLGGVLLSRRHDDAHQGGLWEFPGGKVEPGESVQDALARELAEELGIEVLHAQPLLEVRHDYGDKQVLLDVWGVHRFSGDPRGLEGQPLEWVPRADLHHYSFPAANLNILAALQALPVEPVSAE